MRNNLLLKLLASMTILTALGCGGGGGTSAPTTVVSGVAAKGPVSGGTVKVFAVDGAGVVGTTPIGTASSGVDGSYAVNVGSYTGAVLVEVTGGSYKDEATGSVVTLSTPLRAAISGAAIGDNKVAVTPLTELAVKKAGTLTPTAIDAANLAVGKVFNVGDIITTQPLDATVTPPATATAAQKSYALALATVSQLIKDKGVALPALLTQVGDELAGTGLSGDTVTSINSALVTFAASAGNKTGVGAGSVTQLKPTSGLLKISTVGNLAAGALIGGIDVTITLPAGVSIQADASGQPAAGVITVSGIAAAAGAASSAATYTPAGATTPASLRIQLASAAAGFGAGEFITVKCDVATSAAFPKAADFIVPASSLIVSGGTELNNPGPLAGFTAAQTFVAVIP